MIRSIAQALQLVRTRRVVTLTPLGALPSLVAEVAGAPVRGSWWGHPEGKRIYALASALEDAPSVLCAKLVLGKVAFVHQSLWPALLRLATDAGARHSADDALDAAARKLLALVERRGEVRLDALAPADLGARDAKDLARARVALERRALVLSGSVHTESGRHAALLRSWRAWAEDDSRDAVRAAAARLTAEDARAALRPYWTLAGSSADAM